MRREKLLKVILAPHLSEKAASQYVFKVAKTATKHDVKDAIEELFKVNVKAVNIVNSKGASVTRFGRTTGKFASWKKAYVSLEAGQQINIQ